MMTYSATPRTYIEIIRDCPTAAQVDAVVRANPKSLRHLYMGFRKEG
jgi:hypothetical protein